MWWIFFPRNIFLQIWWSTPSPKRTGNVWQECSLFIFIFLITAALNVFKTIFFRLKNAKNCQRKKKHGWKSLEKYYSALEFAAHLCASIISFWVWSMWFTQVLRMDNSQTKQFRKFFDSMFGPGKFFWEDLPFPWLSRKPKHLSLCLQAPKLLSNFVTLLKHKYTPLDDQHPF